MLHSMTGFASQTFDLPVGNQTATLTIQFKSLNARFLETSCRLPHALSHLEHALTKMIKSKLKRGSVFCTINLENPSALSGPTVPVLSKVESYLEAADTIHQIFGDKYHLHTTSLSLKDILDLPGVFETQGTSLEKKTEKTLIEHVEKTIEKLIKDRKKEGTALQKDLELRLEAIKEQLKLVEDRAQHVLEKRKKVLLQTAEDIIKHSTEEAKEHHLQQVYQQLEKLDVHEEIVRFKAHAKQMNSLLKNKQQEKGKKIVFTLQELFREINTVTSKCADSQLSNAGITIKVELEKAREQAQNIV